MNLRRKTLSRLKALFQKRRLDLEMNEEMLAHIEMRTRENIDAGMAPREARLAAVRQFGGIESIKETCRDQRGVTLVEHFLQDLQYSLRMIRKNPTFAAVAILTLSLGIGANSAIFSVVNTLLLRSLPYPDSEHLLWIGGRKGNDKQQGITPADFLDYQAQSSSFNPLAASVSETVPMNLTGGGEPERLSGAMVTANYMDVFGIKPALGRTFLSNEDEEGQNQVVILSHKLWMRRFGGDPSILQKSIRLEDRSSVVIGIMPPEFQYPPGAELWKPFGFPASGQSPFRSRELHFLRPVAKLRPGITLAKAQAEVDAISQKLETLYPKTNTDKGLFLMPLQERIVGNMKRTLFVLLGAVGCVLLISCVNVANLLLAKAAARQKEIAIRSALGASQRRVFRQLFTESLTLALLGGLGGLLVAKVCILLLVAYGPSHIPRLNEISIDPTVLTFTLLLALLTSQVFGMVPMWRTTNLNLTDTLKQGLAASSGGAQAQRALNFFVIGEVALAMLLLIGAGLLVKSFVRLQNVGPGFDEKNLLTVRLDLPNPYAEPEKKAIFFDQLQQRIATLPSVEAVGLITELPLAPGSSDFTFSIDNNEDHDSNQKHHADIRNVNHDYFRTMRIPLLKGRSFTSPEVRNTARVVVISEVLARQFFPDKEPIGQRLRPDWSKESYEIVGIVGDIRHRGLDAEPRQTIYFPNLGLGYASLVIRTGAAPRSLAAAVRKEVAAIDPNQPIASIKMMEDWIDESVAQPRYRMLLLSSFSTLALVLSVVGIYGVMTYVVAQRTREIGVRMALGAPRSKVLWLILGRGLKLAVIGSILGILSALALTRLIKSLLYGIAATDPLTYVILPLALIGVTLLACFFPARRATLIEPTRALRYD